VGITLGIAEIHAKNQAKINEVASRRSRSVYKLDYSSGLAPSISKGSAKITVDNTNQTVEIIPPFSPPVYIPFQRIKSSAIKTQGEIPPEDTKNEYIYYLNIGCMLNGNDAMIIFSCKEKQYSTIDPVTQLNYILNKIINQFAAFNQQPAPYQAGTQPGTAPQNAADKPLVKCPGCGANLQVVNGEETECIYCGFKQRG
jgi:hypothetical protein